MKDTKAINIPGAVYVMLATEAATRCVKAGCSIDDAVDSIRDIAKELTSKGFLLCQKS